MPCLWFKIKNFIYTVFMFMFAILVYTYYGKVENSSSLVDQAVNSSIIFEKKTEWNENIAYHVQNLERSVNITAAQEMVPQNVEMVPAKPNGRVKKNIEIPSLKKFQLMPLCLLNFTPVVDLQLLNWKSTGISHQDLQHYCVRKSLALSFVNQSWRFASHSMTSQGGSRLICSLWLLEMTKMLALAKGNPLPDVELVLQHTDGAQSTVNEAYRFL